MRLPSIPREQRTIPAVDLKEGQTLVDPSGMRMPVLVVRTRLDGSVAVRTRWSELRLSPMAPVVVANVGGGK